MNCNFEWWIKPTIEFSMFVSGGLIFGLFFFGGLPRRQRIVIFIELLIFIFALICYYYGPGILQNNEKVTSLVYWMLYFFCIMLFTEVLKALPSIIRLLSR